MRILAVAGALLATVILALGLSDLLPMGVRERAIERIELLAC